MKYLVVLALILTASFVFSCSDKEQPSKVENKTIQNTSVKQQELTIEQANEKLSKAFTYNGRLKVQNGTAILEIQPILPAKTLSISNIADGLYQALKIYCETKLDTPKLDLKVFYNLDGQKDLLSEVKTYRAIACNAVKTAEKSQQYNTLRGLVVLNSLRNEKVKVGNEKWMREMCNNDKRIGLFCSHLGF